MTREEAAIKKFEESLTEKQKEIVMRKILRDAFRDAHGIMHDKYKACLYPSINFEASALGVAQLMFNYGRSSHQLWGKDEAGDWVAYKYND